MAKFDDALVTGRYIADLVRRRALAAVAGHDAKLSGAYSRLASRVRQDLVKAGYTPAQIRGLLGRRLAETLEERVRVVEDAIKVSAQEGRTLDRETYDAVFGSRVSSALTEQVAANDVVRRAVGRRALTVRGRAKPPRIDLRTYKAVFGGAPESRAPTFASDAVAQRVASARIRGKTTVDGLSLSARFHKNDAEIVRGMSAQLQASLRAGESVTRTAERLLDEGEPLVRLPTYVQELSEAAGLGKTEFQQAVRKWRSQVSALGQGALGEAGEFTIRSATQQLVRDLAEAKPAEISKVVDRWVLDRARYQARVIARHESVEAFRESAIESWEGQEWVVAVKWSLSPGPRRPDVCDVVAGQDLYGLGPGNYPKDRVPEHHVSCMCTLSAVSDADHFQRELAKAKGEEEPGRPWESGRIVTGNDWLRAQPWETRVAIAGPTRARLVTAGRNVMEDAGSFKPVHELLGQPKPVRHLGPITAARPVILADRASMVRPFPDLTAVKETRAAALRAGKAPSARPKPPKPRRPERVAPRPISTDAALRVATEAELERVRQALPLVGERHEGALPPQFFAHVKNVERSIGENFGLKPTRPVRQVVALETSHPQGDAGGLMDWDGTMLLQFGKATRAKDLHHAIVHELTHTMGGVATRDAYVGSTAVSALEEIATEEITQAFFGAETRVVHQGAAIAMDDVEAALAVVEMSPTALVQLEGQYLAARQRFYAIVASATGESDPAKLTKLVRRTLQRWKRKAYTTSSDAMGAMLDALQPNSANQREFYRRLLDDEEAWKF